MLSFWVWEIYFLLFSGDGEMVGCNCFLYGGFVEDAVNNYDVGILSGLTTRLLFSEMVAAMEYFSLVSSLFYHG
jgi:hypothetical protein